MVILSNGYPIIHECIYVYVRTCETVPPLKMTYISVTPFKVFWCSLLIPLLLTPLILKQPVTFFQFLYISFGFPRILFVISNLIVQALFLTSFSRHNYFAVQVCRRLDPQLIVGLYHSWVMCLPVFEPLGGFQFLAATSRAAVNILIQVFV